MRIWLLFVAALSFWLTCVNVKGKRLSESEVSEVKVHPDGRLFVNNKPFFPLGSWWHRREINPRELSDRCLNTGFFSIGGMSAEKFKETLDKCQQAGVKVIGYFHGAGEDAVRGFLEHRRHPALLAWCLGDDLTLKQLPYVKSIAKLVREVDKAHPTCGDAAATPAADLWQFTPYLDIRMEYHYPVPDLSLEWYAGNLWGVHRSHGQPMWTWIQCFTWTHTNREMGWADTDTSGPLPDPEQVRLLCYTALSQGIRGLLFFHWGCVMGRPEIEGEVACVAAELRVVELPLAGGDLTREVKTNRTDVKATLFTYEGSKLLLLFKAGEQYHRYVDEGVVEKVKVWVNEPQEKKEKELFAYTLSFPTIKRAGCKRIERGVVEVEVGRMELTELVLLTEQRSLPERLKKEHSRRLRQVCGYVVKEAAEQAKRVAECYDKIGKIGVEVPDTRRFIESAREKARRAEKVLANGNPAFAYQIARSALKDCRRAVRQAMEYADSEAAKAPAEAQKYRKVFWSLPQFFAAVRSKQQ